MTTVNDLLDLVLQEYIDNRHSSIVSLKSHLKHLNGYFTPTHANDVRRSDIEQYIKLRRQAKASIATINRELAVLRRAGKLGIEHELIARFVPIKLLKGENVRQGFAEHDEFIKVRDSLPGIYRRPFIFAYYNGRRRGEILKYKRNDVDTELRLLTVRGEITKNGKGGILALEGEVWEAVREAYDANPGPYLFGRTDGKPITLSTFYRNLKDAFKAAGYPDRHFHDLRRTASRNLIRAGNHRKVAKSVTGHITDSMFDRYDIVDTVDLVNAARKVQEYINHKGQPLVEKQEAFRPPEALRLALKSIDDFRDQEGRTFLHKEISENPPKVSLFSRFVKFIKGGV